MMPIENIREITSVGAWNVSCCDQYACRLSKWPKWPDQGTTGRIRHLQTERSFSMMEDFRQSSEAVGLSQVSNILWELTGQISAHYSSFEIKILIYLFFVRTKDHIPYCLPQIWCIKSTNGWFTRHQICCQDFVMKANLLNTKHHFSILASLLERRIEPIDCKV